VAGGDVDWADIQNTPNFATVATTGDYNDLTNTPSIPTIPENVSEFTNDAGYLTEYNETDPEFTAWDKDYNDLINLPTLFDGDYNNLSNQPTLFDGDWSSLNNTPTTIAGYGITDAFTGDYDDLVNAPIVDGSETTIIAGSNISLTGIGTSNDPYIINSISPTTVEILSSQTYTVPQGVSKIRVELWGGAGGGGGIGMYSYSLNSGGTGGSGGYIQQEIIVAPGDQFNVIIGAGGMYGSNAIGYSNGYSFGDTDGTNGGDTWFGSFKAAGGSGGKSGSFSSPNVNGSSGIDNIGSIRAYSSVNGSNILDVFQGLSRSYIFDRSFSSKPGLGGQYLELYSMYYEPETGENGAAVITIF
jgi:hypothetical protein